MLTREEQAEIMRLVNKAVNQAKALGRQTERSRLVNASPDHGLRKPVAETLAELRDYLKEVG